MTQLQPLYKADFYAWTLAQSHLLQTQQWSALDIANLVEEIESLGRQLSSNGLVVVANTLVSPQLNRYSTI
ncbi:hypothetical protein C8255_08300 [filamentous cyanobacterium CCP3]|nr:hypothetical protein C8255_08300 [filamentous cyanobacterium CCP3]